MKYQISAAAHTFPLQLVSLHLCPSVSLQQTEEEADLSLFFFLGDEVTVRPAPLGYTEGTTQEHGILTDLK